MAAASSSLGGDHLGKLAEDFLTCSLCQEYYKNAKTLQCLHSFCEGCLATLVKKSSGIPKCPECRQDIKLPGETTVALMGSNFLINGLVEYVKACKSQSASKSEGVRCDFCEEGVAEKRCADCQINLCQKCVKGHAKISINRGHRLMGLDDDGSETERVDKVSSYRLPMFCETHEENVVKIYCGSCEKPICLECVALDHRPPDHQHKSLKDFTADFINALKDPLEKLQKKEAEARESVEVVTKELSDALDRHQQDLKKIKTHTEEIIVKLRKDEEKLVESVKACHDTEKKQLECEIDQYEIAEKNISSVCDFINALINYGDNEIVALHKQTTGRVDEMLRTTTIRCASEMPATFKPNTEIIDREEMLGTVQVEMTRSRIPKFAITGESVKINVQVKVGDDNTKLDAKVMSPNGTTKQLAASLTSNGLYYVTFCEDQEGIYNLMLNVGSYRVSGSPFAIHVMSGEDMAAKMKVGTVVVRGPDWDQGNKDGNPPGTGRVISGWSGGCVGVKWDSTNESTTCYMCGGTYRYKLHGFY